MKSIGLILFMALGFFSCQDHESATVMDITTLFVFKDAQGKNILDPVNTNSISKDKIKIFYLVNGQAIEFNKPQYSYPEGFEIFRYEPTGEYVMKLYWPYDTTFDGQIGQTFIRWGKSDQDTVTTQLVKRENPQIIVSIGKLQFNGTTVYESPSNVPLDGIIRVIK